MGLIHGHINHDPGIKAGIFQSNFSNPTGLSYSESEKKSLVKIFRDKKVSLIEDDTYGDLSFDGQVTTCLKSFDRQGDTVFLCSSFSKTLGPGFRVAWIIPPKIFLDKVIKLKLSTTFSGHLMSEKLAINFLTKPKLYQNHLKRLNKFFANNLKKMKEDFESFLGAELGGEIRAPQGGFCLWIELAPHIDTF